ncbi:MULTISPECIES: hypothetical protein [unclassified Streptomyces]|uniref:hypothetical protein n=1 Tax=unclassified Streptomyces TaxID=2593676 RepID=UPI002ED61D2C|nr:hypothetical protein OH827_32940 [Streptomyces sp. NBC_00891]WSY09544.1 hypothetical protein OG464_32945 [Streptomyces sp. NBC_00890]WSZ11164.1 hypothetical protein OG704_32945 [Streptomyces sp. NBC_00869]WSZ21330.1 hypothetical protein OG498_00620 [Streptomyces sp. NBC_00870]
MADIDWDREAVVADEMRWTARQPFLLHQPATGHRVADVVVGESNRLHDVLLGLAENPALPTRLFARLVANGDEDVLFTLAHRDQLTLPQVRDLVAVGNPSLTGFMVRVGLVPWPEIPKEQPGRLLDAVLGGIAPAAVWRAVATDPNPEARREVAYADEAPADVITFLVHDLDLQVVASAAANPNLPPELLPHLARHPSTVVRQAVAENENASPALLAALLADGGRPSPTRCGACHRREVACADHAPGVRRVRLAAAGHPTVPPAGLSAFLDAPEDTVTTFAARSDLPVNFLNWLATHPCDDVRTVIAANPAVPETLLRTLAADPVPEVSRAIVENPSVPLDLLTTLVANERMPGEPVPRIESATDLELRTLASCRVAQARALVADRTQLPRVLVEQLATDPDIAVAKRIAARSELAPERLAEITERHGPPVFAAVARHPGCPSALLHWMAAHPAGTRRVLQEIASHPAARSETLLLCLASEDLDTRRLVAAHPALALPVLESLIDAPDGSLAQDAAANPALPERVMEWLITRALRE